MQRIACYSAVALISTIGLVGCSSGWTFANWKDTMTLSRPSPPTDQSFAELKSRAEQLERIQQYDVAAELYAEILKQDHDNEYAQQRLTAIQRRKHGLPDNANSRSAIRESLPVSRQSEQPQTDQKMLPKITPGESERSRSIALRDRAVNPSGPAPQFPASAPGRTSLNATPRAAAVEFRQTQPVASEKNGKKRVPLDQFVARSNENKPVQTAARIDLRHSGPVKLPAIYDKQTIQSMRNPSSPGTGIAQVSMTTIMPEISQPNPETNVSQEYTLFDVQERLSTHPADPSAIEALVQGLKTEDRIGRWEISSTLGVLIQNPEAKSLIVDSLSRALVDKDVQMRQQTVLVIASLGSNARELLPVVEARLNDREEAVREAAAFAIDEIR